MLQSETVTLPSGAIWQVWRGGDAGPLVVWLHGPRAPREADPFLSVLARRARVVAPVMPGFNDLAEIDDIDDVRDLALAYDDLLGALDLGPFILAGHSVGGMVAAEIAAHVPVRAARLALVAPFGLWDEAAPVADLFAMPADEQRAALWADAALAARFAAEDEPPEDPAGLEAAMVAAAQANTTLAKFIWPIPEKGLRKRLHRIAAPTTLIWGAADRVVPASYAQDFAARLPRATVRVLGGRGHMVPHEAPDAVVAAVLEGEGLEG